MGQVGTRGRGLLVAARRAHAGTSAWDLLRMGRADEALSNLDEEIPALRGWQQAASRDYQDLLGFARPALKIAYEADPAGFAGIWHAETGTEAPDWLTRPDESAP